MMEKNHGELIIVKNMVAINLHIKRIEVKFLLNLNQVLKPMELMVMVGLK
jgi:hypothetical protein